MPSLRFTRKRIIGLTMLGVLLPTAFLGYLSVRMQRDMFRFQNRILDEYALFSIDYAVSEVQDRIRNHERTVYLQLRLASLAPDFQAGDALRRLEETFPIIHHAFLVRPDGTTIFATGDERPNSGVVRQAVTVGQDPLWVESLLYLGRETAQQILGHVLDSQTRAHLMESSEPHFFRGQEKGGPFHLTAFTLTSPKGEPYGVAGFFLNLQHVREQFLADLLSEAIEAAEGLFSPDFGRYLTFMVSDHNDDVVYVHKRPGSNAAPDEWEHLSEAELWDVLPGWKVKLVYANPKGPSYRRDIYLSNTLLLLLMAALAIAGILVSLRFSLKQMELANVKSHFVSNITHELKTPLAAIRLYTETLQQDRVQDDNQKQKFLGIIGKECVRLTHLINNILDFSRIELGRKRYNLEPTNLEEVVREILDSYSYQLSDKGFELRTDIEPNLPLVMADRDALGQAILNLIDNATKYSQERKEIELTVRRDSGFRPRKAGRSATLPVDAAGVPADSTGLPAAGPVDSTGPPAAAAMPPAGRATPLAGPSTGRATPLVGPSTGGATPLAGPSIGSATPLAGRAAGGVAIGVRDFGIGIPSTEHKKIFDPFYRVEKGLEHEVKGSGLGLAVVRHVIESHGGTVEVESRRGAGSTFTLRLPAREA